MRKSADIPAIQIGRFVPGKTLTPDCDAAPDTPRIPFANRSEPEVAQSTSKLCRRTGVVVCTVCEVLLLVSGSLLAAGEVTVAVLSNATGGPAGAVPLMVIVTLPPSGNVGMVPDT